MAVGAQGATDLGGDLAFGRSGGIGEADAVGCGEVRHCVASQNTHWVRDVAKPRRQSGVARWPRWRVC